MKSYPKKHNRRSMRLKGYDYSQAGLYFITLNCQHRHHIFGNIKNGMMCLNQFGTIIHNNWMETPNIRPNIVLGAFIVMPDHLHGIIQILESKGSKEAIGKFQSPTQTIGAIIRGYKSSATTKVKAATKAWESSLGKGEFAPTAPTGSYPFPSSFTNILVCSPKYCTNFCISLASSEFLVARK